MRGITLGKNTLGKNTMGQRTMIAVFTGLTALGITLATAGAASAAPSDESMDGAHTTLETTIAPRAALLAGQSLSAGESITSADGGFTLTMHEDGNAVLTGAGNRQLWETATAGSPGSRLVMQSTGTLAVVSVTGESTWSSPSSEPDSRLTLRTDGNLVISKAGKASWDAQTHLAAGRMGLGTTLATGQDLRSPDGRQRLVVSDSGELTLESATGTQTWRSTASDPGGISLNLAADGSLTIHSAMGDELWSIAAQPGADHLELLDTGNLAILDADGVILWDLSTYLQLHQDSAVATIERQRPWIERAEILDRAQYWFQTVPEYDQGATSPGPDGRAFRTDCSGYISMAWDHRGSGIGVVTWTLPSISHKIAWSDVQPGDALLRDGHVVLVGSWDGAGGDLWHMSSPSEDMASGYRTLASLKAQGYTPYQYDFVL